MITYKESNNSYHNVPTWVTSLIKYGYKWGSRDPIVKRRVGLVTTPCDSTAAAFIALGALRSDLERESANDVDSHFNLLQQAREKFLNSGNKNREEVFLLDQHGTKWHFSEERCNLDSINVFVASYKKMVKRKGKLVPNPNGPCTSFINKDNAYKWRLNGQHVVQTNKASLCLPLYVYKELFPYFENRIVESNLSRSYSNLLLVGGGLSANTDYMKKLRSVAFRLNNISLSLTQLLTIEETKESISRMCFNTTQRLANVTTEHTTVIADGARAFLASLSKFRESDVIGVISRDEPPENIDAVSEYLASMKRYYNSIEPKYVITEKSFTMKTFQAK